MRFNEAGKIRKLQQQMQKAVEASLIDMMVIAQNHFMQSFRDQGFTDRGFSSWKRRKEKDSKRGRYGYWEEQGTDDKRGKRHRIKEQVRSVKQGRGILIGKGTGNLRRSIRKMRTGKYTGLIFITGNANKYAKVHNDGLRAGRGRGFKMPQRKFIGDSYNMFQKIDRKVRQRLGQVIK